MPLKRIIHIISKIFYWGFYLNIGFGITSMVLQAINLITHSKLINAAYLGGFSLTNAGYGSVNSTSSVKLFVDYLSATPSIALDSPWHPYLVLIFSMVIWGIVLYYNYQLMQLFTRLNSSINEGSPFHEEVSSYFNKLARFSGLVFIVGSLLSIAKILFITNIQFNEYILKPCFDQGILNFAWLSVGFFIISAIFKIGLQLKTDQELTI